MSQWADDSMTPSAIGIKRDSFGNELPASDPAGHNSATPGEGGFNFSGNQYDDGPSKGGFSKYGASVEDLGQNPNSERTSVNVAKPTSGKE